MMEAKNTMTTQPYETKPQRNENNILTFHSTVAKYSNLAITVDIAKKAGFEAIELSSNKLIDYLEAGYTEQDLSNLLKDIVVPGIGFLIDIERQGAETPVLLTQAEKLFRLANIAGAQGVQILTGPVNVQAVIDYQNGKLSGLYSGLIGYSEAEQISLTAKNITILADLAKQHGLVLYLETLSWSPVNGLAKSLQLLDQANRSNVKIVIDYWHCYTSGVTPEDVSRLDKDLIYGVHICDSLSFKGGIPNETILRDVETGRGVLDLKEWTDAVKATGYDGWWSCETFAKKQQQQNSYEVANKLRTLMSRLIEN